MDRFGPELAHQNLEPAWIAPDKPPTSLIRFKVGYGLSLKIRFIELELIQHIFSLNWSELTKTSQIRSNFVGPI